jgi:Ni/Fe-hydrogenase subunit HybB-like protein
MTTEKKAPFINFWRMLTALIFIAGGYAFYLRFFRGWQAATNLSDLQPWGLWVGFGTLCGVGLSAGGFAIAGAVYLLGMERYRPLVRPAVLLSFLGYSTVCTGMLYELGLPWRIWHPIIYWNGHSVLFDVSLAPYAIEKIPLVKLRVTLLHYHHRVLIGIVLAGVLLSSMHQSFLGGLFLIAKGKVYPLWYSPYLTTLFYLSAIPAGIAMLTIVLYLCVRSLNVKLEYGLLEEMSRVMGMLLAVYAVFRLLDLTRGGGIHYIFAPRVETAYFWLEIACLVIIPLFLLSQSRVRNNPQALYWTCAVVVMGFMANRLNVSITAIDAVTGAHYVPKWPEFALTIAVLTGAAVIFRLAVIYLDILPKKALEPAKATAWVTVAKAAEA